MSSFRGYFPQGRGLAQALEGILLSCPVGEGLSLELGGLPCAIGQDFILVGLTQGLRATVWGPRSGCHFGVLNLLVLDGGPAEAASL